MYAFGLVAIESPEVAKARKVWAESRDPAKALEVFPRHRNVEREVLFGLQKYGVSNALAAIQHVRVEQVSHDTNCSHSSRHWSLCHLIGTVTCRGLKLCITSMGVYIRMYVRT